MPRARKAHPETATALRKRPVQARARATVDAIIEAAAHILVAEGFRGFNTNALARRAGVSIGSLYQYFPTKEAVLIELNRRHALQTSEPILAVLAEPRGRSLQEVVEAVVQAFVDAHKVQPELHQVLSAQLERTPDTAWRQSVEQGVEAAMRACLHRFADQLQVADPAVAVFVLRHSIESTVHHAVVEKPRALRDGSLARELVAMVMRYVARPEAQRYRSGHRGLEQ